MKHSSKWMTGTWTRDGLLTAILFIWLYQLLSLLGQAGGVPDMSGFYLFVGVCLLLDLVVPWRFLKNGLKLAAVFGFLYHFYFAGNPILEKPDGWRTALAAAGDGLLRVVQWNPDGMPEMARTFFFLLFLWLAASVYRNALQSRVWLFVLLVAGEAVLGAIDTFFPPDASGAIVRYFLVGFLLLALSHFPELEKWLRLPRRTGGWPPKWVAWTLAVTLAAVGTGMAAPKYPPAWPDPVAFLQGKGQQEDLAAGAKKIGYGTDDSRLGGPYVMDDTVAFTVLTGQAGYYRGEAKVFYTGKGWVENGDNVMPMPRAGRLPAVDTGLYDEFGISPEVKKKRVEQRIQIENGRFDAVFGQYVARSVQPEDGASPDQAVVLRSFRPQGWKWGAELTKGKTYTVVSEVPYYDPDGVKQREQRSGQSPKATPPAPFMELYLQLPPTLPDRVAQLAREITVGQQGNYDKAKAIEQFLRTHYTYETKDVPFPAENQDFVDQFLFESRRGYCDQFSSAMVVLARAAGLPARWVKGFTEGEQDPLFSGTEGRKKYVVRNRNAHSWAEVYIPGSGWLPFEPTPTFSQPVVMQDLPVTAPASRPDTPPQQPETRQPPANDTSVQVAHEIDWKTVGTVAWWMGIVLLVAGLVFRRPLLAAYYVRRFAGKAVDENSLVVLAIERLLRVLQRFGFRRDPGLTFRELGGEWVRRGYEGGEWVALTRIFERVRYGNKPVDKGQVSELRELWKRIVRKMGRTKNR